MAGFLLSVKVVCPPTISFSTLSEFFCFIVPHLLFGGARCERFRGIPIYLRFFVSPNYFAVSGCWQNVLRDNGSAIPSSSWESGTCVGPVWSLFAGRCHM